MCKQLSLKVLTVEYSTSLRGKITRYVPDWMGTHISRVFPKMSTFENNKMETWLWRPREPKSRCWSAPLTKTTASSSSTTTAFSHFSSYISRDTTPQQLWGSNEKRPSWMNRRRGDNSQKMMLKNHFWLFSEAATVTFCGFYFFLQSVYLIYCIQIFGIFDISFIHRNRYR